VLVIANKRNLEQRYSVLLFMSTSKDRLPRGRVIPYMADHARDNDSITSLRALLEDIEQDLKAEGLLREEDIKELQAIREQCQRAIERLTQAGGSKS
ncbi:MAG TPA: hypothetical protein VFM05_10120, partial [Candidatus Saccharimonadales bacterium]|nr:hypothetical protein [Candidatus Saccharimonadales bacterium]